MNDRVDLSTTLIEVAHLYYEENLSQQEIADRLNVSRSLIALYLKKAREKGFVRIDIVDPRSSLESISDHLADRFDLETAVVVPSAHNSKALTRRALGNALAQYLDRTLKDGDVLGLGWGRTMMEMVNLLAPAKPRRIDVVPLLGESGYTGSFTQLNQIVLQAARSFSGTPYFLLTPILVGNRDLRDALMRDPVASHVVEMWDQLSVACVGVGVVPPIEGQIVYIGEENIPKMIQMEAVGDLCARYFNLNGVFISTEFNERMIAVSLEQLRKAENVVAIAEGAEKAMALLGALRSRLIKTLFVDESLALVLLSEMEG